MEYNFLQIELEILQIASNRGYFLKTRLKSENETKFLIFHHKKGARNCILNSKIYKELYVILQRQDRKVFNEHYFYIKRDIRSCILNSKSIN